MVKTVFAIAALAASVTAITNKGYPADPLSYSAPQDLNELFSTKENLYGSSWETYKKTRQLMVDCDIYESENWLGSGKCKYSWECRGARMCEGQGFCYGDDSCEVIHE